MEEGAPGRTHAMWSTVLSPFLDTDFFHRMEITWSCLKGKKKKPRQFKAVHRKWGGRKVKSIEPLLHCRALARLLPLTHLNRGDGVGAYGLNVPCTLQAGERTLVLGSAPLQSLPLLCLRRDREGVSIRCPECIFLCK